MVTAEGVANSTNPAKARLGRFAQLYRAGGLTNTIYLRRGLRLNAVMGILSLFRWAKSRHADGKADFERVTRETGLLPAKSAFDVAIEEDRRADADAWAKLEQYLKP